MRGWAGAVAAGILVGALSLWAVAWNASTIQARRRAEMARETHLNLHQLGGRLRSSLEKHILALEQMASFIENSERVEPAEFRDFAATTMARLPSCLRVSLLDAAGVIRRVHPLEPNREMIGFDARRHPRGHQAIRRAVDTNEPVFSPPLRLLDRAQGFILAVPIRKQERPAGAVVGAYRNADFAAAILLPEVARRYDQVVLAAGVPLDDSRIDGLAGALSPGAESTGFALGGVYWEVRTRPRPEVAREMLGSGMPALWTLGVLVSLLAGGAAGALASWTAALRARLAFQGGALQAARERLDGAMKQLLQAEKMTALGELVAGVAHEMNNPLASIIGYTQLVLAQDLPDPQRRRLETVHGEAERMARIVRNLLTFARKHPPERTLQDLNAVIGRTLELKAYHFRVNQIRVETDLHPDLPRTQMDPHQMQQVILNLLNNAEQALAGAGRGGTIRLTTGAAHDRIALRVADDGPGIPEAIREKIFEPFFTTKKEGQGTGLGLSLCYGIVEGHGGTIRVESRPGGGATFLIDLPVVETGPPPAAPRGGPAAAGGRLRILVIDPEQAVSRFLVELLSSRGHRVDTAADVTEALRKAAGDDLDLVISDLALLDDPRRNLYRELQRRNPRLLRRIIFTTGDGASGEVFEFISRSGNALLHKPCRIEELEGAIERAMRG
jgi:signal transduction histidine kinase/CheY-like chemotaxis protein